MRFHRAVAAALLAASWLPTGAAAQQPAPVLHKIELHPGQKAGLCIGPTAKQAEVFPELVTMACDRDWSVFTFVSSGDQPSWDAVQRAGLLVHERTGLCVGSQGDSAQAGARLVLDDCAARDSQRWVFSGSGIVNARSRLCLGSGGAAGALDAPVVQAACSKQETQAFSHSRTVATRQLASTPSPGRPIASKTAPAPATAVGMAGQMSTAQALQVCGMPAHLLADQLAGLPPGAATAMAGACLAERHAGRLLRAGFHLFYVNRTGQKQRIDAARVSDCGFGPRDLVLVEPEILAAIPTGEPMPTDAAACAKARQS